MQDPNSITEARVLLLCEDFQEALSFYTDQLGFRVDQISPADDPRIARLSGHGLSIELRRGGNSKGVCLELACRESEPLAPPIIAPNGVEIRFVSENPPQALPELHQELVVLKLTDKAKWITGRAGMRYRDLIPGRLGGRFIASHIVITEGGSVPDSVHFHQLRFQMIFCAKGWVDVVYEDQGPPIRLQAGDCFLQPPLIRHRVLECSPGLEVIEIASPAEHETFLDHELELPTSEHRPERNFSGQQFVHHSASDATWADWVRPGFECRDLGVGAATSEHATARVVRTRNSEENGYQLRHESELYFLYIISGELELTQLEPEPIRLSAGDSVAIPARREFALANCSRDLELLEVEL